MTSDEWPVAHLSVSAYTTALGAQARQIKNEVLGKTDGEASVAPDDRIQLILVWNAPNPVKVDGIMSYSRFAHVRLLEVDGTRYPVDIETYNYTDSFPSDGEWLHTGERYADLSEEVPALEFREEARKFDWNRLLHGDSPVPIEMW